MVTPDSILAYCMEHLEGVVLRESWGERGIYYNPGETLPRGVYILTIKEKDGENDRASQLDREGVYRVNLGLRKPSFRALFGELPKRPPAGGVVEMPYDFAALDRLIPHGGVGDGFCSDRYPPASSCLCVDGLDCSAQSGRADLPGAAPIY